MSKYFPVNDYIQSRREFVQASAGAILATTFASSRAAAQEQINTDRKLGLAIVGLGGFASTSVAPEIVHCKHVKLAGVVTGDPDVKGRDWARRYDFPKNRIYAYDDMDRMAAAADIDLVHVITPNGLHAEHTIRAASAGKHVMCEKPMAISSAQCENMIAACKKNGVKLGIDYRLQFEPHHVEMASRVRGGKYGQLTGMMAEFSWNRGNSKPWLLDISLAGGGAFFDTGVYAVQAGCYLSGETPESVSALSSSIRPDYPTNIEEIMCATYRFPSGAVLQARASYCVGCQMLTATCTRGMLSCEKPEGMPGSTFGQSANGKPNCKILSLPGGATHKVRDELQIATLLDAFANSIMSDERFKVPGEIGLRDLRILEATYRSSKRNGQLEAIG